MKKNAFTLIELLVVISIISILSMVGFVSFQNVRTKALDAKRRADIDAIKKAYETNFDPTLNGGQGGYKPLTDAMFASGKIPTPDNTTNTSYIVVGPDATGVVNKNSNNFLACTPINGATGTCTADSNTCKCAGSSGGIGTGTYTTPPAIAKNSSISSTSKTQNYTVGNGNNRLLVVVVSESGNDGSCTVTAVKWKNTYLTKAGCKNASNAGDIGIWYLKNPASGPGDIAVTTTVAGTVIIVSDWVNVDQTVPLENLGIATMANSSSNGTTLSVSGIPTAINDVIVDGAYGYGGLSNVNDTQILIGKYGNTGSSYVNNAVTPLITSMGWTQASQAWAMVAISLKQAI